MGWKSQSTTLEASGVSNFVTICFLPFIIFSVVRVNTDFETGEDEQNSLTATFVILRVFFVVDKMVFWVC